MTDTTSKNMFALLENRGAMGLVMKVLEDSSAVKTKKNYQQLKEQLLACPLGMMDMSIINQYLEPILDQKELVFVVFKKAKNNGKVGHKKEFKKGFCYYIGMDPEYLSKVYAHWDEEKNFLLKNIACLKNKSFYIETSTIDFMQSIFCLDVRLYDSEEKTSLEAEICLYAGYNES